VTPLERRVRALVYRSLLDTTRAPDPDALATAIGVSAADVDAALRRLAEQHLLVLMPGATAIWMAHPFSAVPTPFPVAVGDRTYYANCAWDAAGVLSIAGDGACAAACGDCGADLSFAVSRNRISGSGVVHFAVPARRFWDDIAFT